MQIQHLKLLNFRNYERLEIDFGPAFNLIYGKNGMGKTNLIESIYVLALTKSFRGTVDKVVIMNNKELTRIEADIVQKRSNNFKLIITGDGKTAKINNNKVAKLSDYISMIGVILFNPGDLRIIKDSPSIRRKSLNVDISQLNNTYLKYLSSYNKILKQRNAYLKTMSINGLASTDYLDSLTEKMIGYGIKVFQERKKILELINLKIGKIYNSIMQQGSLTIEYESDYEGKNQDELFKLYKKNLKRDLFLGKTEMGIHKDDYIFSVDDKPLKDYGSEGQQKNAIIAYKFALIDIYKDYKGEMPILILDDLFSELDYEKINNILKLINDEMQILITTTEIDKIEEAIVNKAKKFYVNNGIIEEV